MFLVCYGTRPELIKLFPIIEELKKTNTPFRTLFTGQHKDLIKDFKSLSGDPDYVLDEVMEHGQSLNSLVSKIINKSDSIISSKDFRVIVQGDSSTSYAAALSAFNNNKQIIHIEAGLRTNDLKSPFPEEGNRAMISHIADFHFCPTKESVANLKNEGINKNVFLVGNTIVDSFKILLDSENTSPEVKNLIDTIGEYYLVTLHRRENRSRNFENIWSQLNEISKNKNIIYITHPSVPDSRKKLENTITKIDPVKYQEMLFLIKNSKGIISDSGGLQEEAVCAERKILICRDTTERPETIECGYGRLVGTKIIENMDFFEDSKNDKNLSNPYGNDVSKKIISILNN
jgi:UDP-N-acetylglucosamine 2-epimerase (non-hydrolysing)